MCWPANRFQPARPFGPASRPASRHRRTTRTSQSLSPSCRPQPGHWLLRARVRHTPHRSSAAPPQPKEWGAAIPALVSSVGPPRRPLCRVATEGAESPRSRDARVRVPRRGYALNRTASARSVGHPTISTTAVAPRPQPSSSAATSIVAPYCSQFWHIQREERQGPHYGNRGTGPAP